MAQTPSASLELTDLLLDWRQGDAAALEKLIPLVYEELRRIAHRQMQRERTGHTLQTTALVNEAYLRLAGQDRIAWQDRAHFFAVAAQVMRHVLVDYARKRRFAKRGGGQQPEALNESSAMSPERATELVSLDEALNELAMFDERKARVVELRYFGGMSLEETAEALDISVMTVRRDWRAARAWLFQRLNEGKI